VPHHRSYGKNALDAYTEMVELSRLTGCPLHLAHATLNFAPNAGQAPKLLALIDRALDDGIDITLDSYPYLAGATTLASMLPSWASAGGAGQTLARLADPVVLSKIRADLEVHGSDGSHGVVVQWDTIEISGVRHPELGGQVGRTVADLASDAGRQPFEVFVALLTRRHWGPGSCSTSVTRTMSARSCGIGAHRRQRRHLVGAKPHPRAWGTFPRYLGHYCRELGLLSLEETVHHLTGRPAGRLGWTDLAAEARAGTRWVRRRPGPVRP
jgi:N-acyl-D-amino-acid deacylase